MSDDTIRRYEPDKIERKWREHWESTGAHKAIQQPDKKRKYYCLDMFPYPSGSGLHVGHWRGYVLSDVLARYHRLHGQQVLHPMGWDAFGLPAENDAIKKGKHPQKNTKENIDNMRRQLKEIGAMYDWSREFATTDPDYYRWTQWIFLRMLNRGLAYQDNVPINWCPSCKCGVANEEVVNGACERCGTETEKRDRKQWMMRITAYAERLLNDLDRLQWPEKVKIMQRNWIGRSEGAKVIFKLIGADGKEHDLPIFTTRPDTLFGATYVVLAPEHPLAIATATSDRRNDVERYVNAARMSSDIDRARIDKEKTGVATGAFAINPINGKKVPVWIADYVLLHYGTGAIMAVPGHDERDFEFATKFNLPVIEVIQSPNAVRDPFGKLAEAYVGEGVMVNSSAFDGMPSEIGKKKVTDELAEKKLAEWTVNYRLRDWVFARQRYWGEPIPVVHCDKCGIVGVPEKELPVLLPEVDRYQVSGTGDSPLATMSEWVNTKCPKCKGPAKRETDTMPQWAGSCWYFLRFASPHYKDGPFDPAAVDSWMPVDMYVGGVEHAILHLLYARFFIKVLYDEALIKFDEPFEKLFNQGMISRQSFRCNECRKWWPEEDVKDKKNCPTCNSALEITLDKMSKSKANSISPDELVQTHGTDAVRLYELFVGPPELDAEWTTNGIDGCSRFLRRFFTWVDRCAPGATKEPEEITRARHVLIKNVTERIDKFRLNTAIAAFMEFINAVDKLAASDISLDTLKQATVCLAPFAPHIAEELWSTSLGQKGSIFDAHWPKWDPKYAAAVEIELVLQINGKVYAKVAVPVDLSDEELRTHALEHPRIKDRIQGKTIKKVIVVPNRLVNLVVV